MTRTNTSEEHKKAWIEFDDIMHYRANIGFITLATMGSLQLLTGQAQFQLSAKYIEEGQSYNKEFIDPIFVYLKFLNMFMMISRWVIIFASKWNMKLTQYYVYWQILLVMSQHTLPQDFGSHQLRLVYWQNWGLFIALGFNLKTFMFCIAA